nr:S8 family serine peptidase [Elusimicrobiota bacterium]
ADNGADIINMSFGASSGSQALENAVNSAYSKGVFLVAASGNDNKLVYYPAAYDNVMAVGATNENDVRESYSNYGTQLDVMAPGSGIYSTLRSDNYGEMSGTSMACPFVAGEAALIISYWEENNIYYRPVDIKNIIIYGCDDIGSYGRDNMTGHGRINIGTSLTQAKDGVVRIDEEKSIVYPNPFNPETTNALFIMPADTSENIQELNIYSLNGEKVRSYGSGGKNIAWDGKNDAGKFCSSGLYYYYIATSAGSQKGKVTLIR